MQEAGIVLLVEGRKSQKNHELLAHRHRAAFTATRGTWGFLPLLRREMI